MYSIYIRIKNSLNLYIGIKTILNPYAVLKSIIVYIYKEKFFIFNSEEISNKKIEIILRNPLTNNLRGAIMTT